MVRCVSGISTFCCRCSKESSSSATFFFVIGIPASPVYERKLQHAVRLKAQKLLAPNRFSHPLDSQTCKVYCAVHLWLILQKGTHPSCCLHPCLALARQQTHQTMA